MEEEAVSNLTNEEMNPEFLAWEMQVQIEDVRCSVCAMTVPYGNRELYFRTTLCGYCAQGSATTQPKSSQLATGRLTL
jgi:hypothetical protein